MQATLRVHRAAKPAVMPSQAPATVSIAESSADTFPAPYALQPADASTCCASFPGACLVVEPEGAPVHPHTGTLPPPLVRSGSSRDRAAGIGDGRLLARSGGIGAPSKKFSWHPAAPPSLTRSRGFSRSVSRSPTTRHTDTRGSLDDLHLSTFLSAADEPAWKRGKPRKPRGAVNLGFWLRTLRYVGRRMLPGPSPQAPRRRTLRLSSGEFISFAPAEGA
jgi:hypothetical protein